MIRQQVGDVLEIHFEDKYYYIVILTKIVMFGGNIIFAFYGNGKRKTFEDLTNSKKGFNVCTDIILAKREGLVERIGKVDNVEKFFKTKYLRGIFIDKEGKPYGYWWIYHISDLRKHVTKVKRLTGKYKNARDQVTYPFPTVAHMIMNNYKPNNKNYLYPDDFGISAT
ncbi:MAG: hypothetical protein WBB64_12310 [Anaerolineales bacterium]